MQQWVLFVLILIVFPAQADFKAGLVAYGRKDYVTAYQEFKPLATEGNAQAQVELGALYFTGKGIPQNYDEAAKWFFQAAKQNSAIGQAWLAVLYMDGKGVAKDLVKAYAWMLLSAAQNYEEAIQLKASFEKRNLLSNKQIIQAQNLAKQWHEYLDEITLIPAETPSSSIPQALSSPKSPQPSLSQQLGQTLGDVTFSLGQVVAPSIQDMAKGLTNSLVENTFKGTFLEEPTRKALHPDEVIVIHKELSECIGKDGVVNQRVLDCMHGK